MEAAIPARSDLHSQASHQELAAQIGTVRELVSRNHGPAASTRAHRSNGREITIIDRRRWRPIWPPSSDVFHGDLSHCQFLCASSTLEPEVSNDTHADQTVRDIAIENPATVPVFESLGIDYCCGGKRPFEKPANALSFQWTALWSCWPAIRSDAGNTRRCRPLERRKARGSGGLYRRATPRLYSPKKLRGSKRLTGKVAEKHGDAIRNCHRSSDLFAPIAQELFAHMMKEEKSCYSRIFPNGVGRSRRRARASCLFRRRFRCRSRGCWRNMTMPATARANTQARRRTFTRRRRLSQLPRPVSRAWKNSSATCTAIFTWKTISSFRAQRSWSAMFTGGR